MKAACLLVLALSAQAYADNYPRQPGVDVLHYTFRITLSDDTDAIEGAATIDVRFLADGVSEFALDLTSTANGKGMTVADVTAGGKPALYKHEADRLVLALAPPANRGERRQFTVRYRGVPAGGLRIGPNKYGERTFFSRNWPDQARQWLPTVDHPYDKATSEFIVTAPARYQVVANGLLQEETDLGDGRRLTHWSQPEPIASWLNAIGVAQFSARQFGFAQSIPLQTWVFHQDRDPGMLTFDGPARQAIEFYSDFVGSYPYEKLASVEAAGVTGGMEHASSVFYGEKSVTGRPAFSLVAHEVAHQWFGDSVTENDWDDVWLSEGFATYFALLAAEHYQGRDAFVAGLKRSRDRIFALEAKSPEIAVRHHNLSDMRKVLNEIVYQKGGWTLHMLRGMVGDEKFWSGIRAYYREFRDRNASTEDLRRVMEETSGLDLAWFFRQWLDRPGSPSIEGVWKYDAAAGRVSIDLRQSQPGDVYRLPVEIAIASAGTAQSRIEKIEMTEKRQRFEFEVAPAPVAVDLDPNTWLLARINLVRNAN